METEFLKTLLNGSVFSYIAHVADHTEIERDGWEAEVGSVGSECVLKGGGGGVGGLGNISDGANGRGEEDEEVKGGFGKAVVEVPGPLDFGGDRGGVVFESHVLEEGVLE